MYFLFKMGIFQLDPASYVSLPEGNHEPPFFSKYPEIIRNYQEILINQENHPARKIPREYPPPHNLTNAMPSISWIRRDSFGVSSMGPYIKKMGA